MTVVKGPNKIEQKQRIKKVKSILISQPAPENGKSPYFDLAKKHNIKIDFRPFIHVEGVPWKEFRKERKDPLEYTAIIFTSKNAIEHFFRVCKEAKKEMPATTKYFCRSEAIALYLQKFIQYRKRKVFYGKGPLKGLQDLLKKHKANEKFMLPCSDVNTRAFPDFLRENEFDYDEAVIYKTVSSDLSDLENIFYDMIVFFSPLGLKSLYENFPKFEQNNTRLAIFGPATAKCTEDYGLYIDIKAPAPESPSMTMAIDKYVKVANK